MKKHLLIIASIILLFCAGHPAQALTNAGMEKRDPKGKYFWEFRGMFIYLTDDPNNYDFDDQDLSDEARNSLFAKIKPNLEFTLGWAHRPQEITGRGDLVDNMPDPKKIAYKIRYGCGWTPPQVFKQTSAPIIVPFPYDDSATTDQIKVKFKLFPGAKDCFCKIWIEMKELDQFGQYSDKMPVLGAANSRPIQVCDNPPVGSYPPVIETSPAKFNTTTKGFDFPYLIRDMGNVANVSIKALVLSLDASRYLHFYGNLGKYEKDPKSITTLPPFGILKKYYHGSELLPFGFQAKIPFCYFFRVNNGVAETQGKTYCALPNASAPGGFAQIEMRPPNISIDKINAAPAKKVSIKAHVNDLGGGAKVLAVHQVLKTKVACDDLHEEEWLNSKNKPKEFTRPGEYAINWDFGKSDLGAHYCYRFFAANEGNKSVAGPFSFIVQDVEDKDILLVLPPAASQITDTSAVLSADVFKPEEIKSVSFSLWRKDKSGEQATPDIAKSISKNFVSYQLENLIPGAKYEYNAKGINRNNKEFWSANSEIFSTKPGKPSIVLDSSSVSERNNDASFTGHIEEFGGNPKVKIRVFLYPAETAPNGLWDCESRDGQVGNAGNTFDLGWRESSSSPKFSYTLRGVSMQIDRPYCFYFGATGSLTKKSSFTEPTLTLKNAVAPQCVPPDIVRRPTSFELTTKVNYTGNLTTDKLKVYFKWIIFDANGKQVKSGFKPTANPEQEFKLVQNATTSLTLKDVGSEAEGKKVCVYALAKNLTNNVTSRIGKDNEACKIFPALPKVGDTSYLMLPNGEGSLSAKVKNFGSGKAARVFYSIKLTNLKDEAEVVWPIDTDTKIQNLQNPFVVPFDQVKLMRKTKFCAQLQATGETANYKKYCDRPISERESLEIKFCAASDCLETGNFECVACTNPQKVLTNTDLTTYSQMEEGGRNPYASCKRSGNGRWPCIGTGGTSGGCGDTSLAMAVTYFYKNNEKVAKLFDQQYAAIIKDSKESIFKVGNYSYTIPGNKIYTYNFKSGDNWFNSTCNEYLYQYDGRVRCDDNDQGLTKFTPTPFRFLRWVHYNRAWNYGGGDWQIHPADDHQVIYDVMKKIGLTMTPYASLSPTQVKTFTDRNDLVLIRCSVGSGTHYLTIYKVDKDYVYLRDPAQTLGSTQHDKRISHSTFRGYGCGTPNGSSEVQWVIADN